MAKRADIERTMGDWTLVRIGPSPIPGLLAGVVDEASHGVRPFPKGRAVLALKSEQAALTFEDRPGSFAFVEEDAICACLSETARIDLFEALDKEDAKWKPSAK